MSRRWKKRTSLNEGGVFKTKYGREFVIGKYDPKGNKYECIFSDLIKWVEKTSIDSGSIKHPNDITVFSNGFIGLGGYNPVNNKDAYKKWMGMLKRVYSKDSHYIKVYEKVTVCEEWHNFQKFSEWFYSQGAPFDWELDKDLFYIDKEGTDKKYSKDTCFLVPSNLNKMLRGFKYNPKVQKEKRKYRAYTELKGEKLELGRFHKESNAKLAIVTAKISAVEQWLRESNIPFELNTNKVIEIACRKIKDENQ